MHNIREFLDRIYNNVREFFRSPSLPRTLTLIGLIVIAIALPVTVIVLQQTTQYRQSAHFENCPVNEEVCGNNSEIGNWCSHTFPSTSLVHITANQYCGNAQCTEVQKNATQCGYRPPACDQSIGGICTKSGCALGILNGTCPPGDWTCCKACTPGDDGPKYCCSNFGPGHLCQDYHAADCLKQTRDLGVSATCAPTKPNQAACTQYVDSHPYDFTKGSGECLTAKNCQLNGPDNATVASSTVCGAGTVCCAQLSTPTNCATGTFAPPDTGTCIDLNTQTCNETGTARTTTDCGGSGNPGLKYCCKTSKVGVRIITCAHPNQPAPNNSYTDSATNSTKSCAADEICTTTITNGSPCVKTSFDPSTCVCNKNDSSGRAFTCSGGVSRSCGDGMFCAGPKAQGNLWPCIPDDENPGTCASLLGAKGIHNTACIHAGQSEPTNYDQVHLNGTLPIPCYNGGVIPGSCWAPRGNTNLSTINPLSLDFGVSDTTISNYVSFLGANSTCISIIRNDVCTVACQIGFGTQFICNGLCNAALGIAQWAGTVPYKAAIGGACVAASLTSGNGYNLPLITTCAKAITQNLFSRVDSVCKNSGTKKTCATINKDWVCANSAGQCSDGYKNVGSPQNVTCSGGTRTCCMPSGTSTTTPTSGGGPTCTNGQDTKIALSIKLDGIGTSTLENNNPAHPNRTGKVRVFDTSNPNGSISPSSQAFNFGTSDGKFDSATIDIGSGLNCGASYKVEVKLPGYLATSADIKYGDTSQVVNLEPLGGDINQVDNNGVITGDGKIWIEDYSIYKTCRNQDPNTPQTFQSQSNTVQVKCSDLINFYDFQDGGTMESNIFAPSGIGEWDANYNLWLRNYVKANGY